MLIKVRCYGYPESCGFCATKKDGEPLYCNFFKTPCDKVRVDDSERQSHNLRCAQTEITAMGSGYLFGHDKENT